MAKNPKQRITSEKVDFSIIAAEIQKTPVEDFVHDVYLPYAHYVIRERALVAEDGLKPVNRRILYAMYRLGLSHDKKYLKAKTVSGETMGRYHPHGDSSIDAAMARMGQIHNMRVPLIDAQGSIGKVPGSTPADGRYWEARMTRAGEALVEEISDGVTTMVPNYDDTTVEPTVLPVRWPQVIVNGTQGIAVGYASNIFSHNPGEVMDAIEAYILNPDLTVDELLKIMPGPDMPTGGELVGIEGVRDYYETGRGTFTIRGTYEINPMKRGQTEIAFFEVPYQVAPESVREEVKKARAKGFLTGLASDPKDLGGKDGLYIQFVVKSGANVVQALREIFKYTSLEQKFSSNMTVLHNGVPQLTPMLGIMKQFVELREEAIVKRTQSKIAKTDDKVERIEGLLKVLVDIDKAIKIIRESDTAPLAQISLQKTFKINEEQADYVLSMPLRRLTKSDKLELNAQLETHSKELARLKDILSSDDKINAEIIRDIRETKLIIDDERRTHIINVSAEELVANERAARKEITQSAKNAPCVVTLFGDNQIIKTNKAVEQGLRGARPILSTINTSTHDNIFVVMRDGTAGRIPTTFIHEEESDVSITGYQAPQIVGFGAENFGKNDVGILVVTSKGSVNIVNGGFPLMEQFQLTKLDEDEELIYAQTVTKADLKKSIVMITEDAQIAYFDVDEIRTSNSGAGTIRGMVTDNKVVGVSIIDVKDAEVVSCTHKTVKVTPLNEIPARKRGAKGVRLQTLHKDDLVINALAGHQIIATKNDKGIRLPEASARAAKGTNRSGTGIVLGQLKP